jgi:hypothetical protein
MLNYNNILIRQCSQLDDITLTLPLVDMARINTITISKTKYHKYNL